METTYNYKVFYGNAPDPGGGAYPAPDAWTGIAELDFTTGTKIIMVWVWDQFAVLRLSFDGITYGDDIVLHNAPQAEPFYYCAQKAQIINFTPGATAIYQIKGQW